MKPTRAILSILFICAFLLQGCTIVPEVLAGQVLRFIYNSAESAPSHTEFTGFTDSEIINGIQESIDTFSHAYRTNDLKLLEQVTDQDNLPFRRLLRTSFDLYQERLDPSVDDLVFIVDSIKLMPYGYVLAHMTLDWTRAVDWTFRYAGDRWILSEPTAEQIGELERVETDRFTFVTYSWCSDYNQEIMDLMVSAADHVELDLGKVPDSKVIVAIVPDYSVVHDLDPSASAIFLEGDKVEDDRILVYSPTAFSFGSYDAVEGWQPELESNLVHEYTHFVHIRAFDHAAERMEWFGEGLAEYVSDSDRVYEITDALAVGQLIPIVDESKVNVIPQDLMHLYSLKSDLSLGYAEAQSLVGYIKTHYGGFDALWRLADAFDYYNNFDFALQKAFRTTYAEFDADWRAWLEIHYSSEVVNP